MAGANEAGYHFMNTNYGRDYLANLVVDLVLANEGDVCPNCSGSLAALNAEFLADSAGRHYDKILVVLAELHHDDKGLNLPELVAPFTVHLMHIPAKEFDTRAKAEGDGVQQEAEQLELLPV